MLSEERDGVVVPIAEVWQEVVVGQAALHLLCLMIPHLRMVCSRFRTFLVVRFLCCRGR